MQIGELDAILDHNEKKTFTPEILDVIAEYYPRFAECRKVNELVSWINKKYDKNLSVGSIKKRFYEMQE